MYGVRVDWMLVDLAIKFTENHIHMKRDRIIAITIYCGIYTCVEFLDIFTVLLVMLVSDYTFG